MVMHNRLSDTNREYACSRGLATVLPMDYATQTLTVANQLPRVPEELDIWQFMAKGKDRVFEVSVRITPDVCDRARKSTASNLRAISVT